MTVKHYISDYVVTDRNNIIENRYSVHAAVVDDAGRLLYAVGDPSRMTLHRSAAKPAQALAVLETPDFLEKFDFDDADIALMCASHNSEPRHIDRARSMLRKVGASEDALRCGGHPSICPNINRAWIKNDFVPTGICNNCSGKHAGMLGGARALGFGFKEYHQTTHPIQIQVKQVVGELASAGDDINQGEVKWGIDGCNLPAPASPLNVLAKMYAHFAHAKDALDAVAVDDQVKTPSLPLRTLASGRVFRCMAGNPELVGGQGRFCTELMAAFDGSLIGKVGADGCYAIGVRASDCTSRLGARGAIGIAVKIEDGNQNILYSAVLEILERLQIGTVDERQRLVKYRCEDILNTAGVVTGHVSHVFQIRSTV